MIETTLQKCLKAVIDNRGVTPHKKGTEWQDYGVPVLSANNVKTTGLQKLDEIRYISEEIYPSWMKIPLEKGDIILTSEAPAGEVFYWDYDKKVVLGQRLYGLKVKDEINPKYLKYYLQSSVGQKAIQGQNSGSTVFGIAAATFPNIMVNLLEKEDQDLVAELLYSIDSKIANNNSICADLEAMAKLLYDYWFVQFDFPDENGKPYKSSGGKMVWNEELKREIPEGWSVQPLSFFSKIITDSLTPQSGNMYYHFSIPAFDENGLPAIESGEEINSNKYRVPENSVLVSKLNPQFKRLWFVEKPQDNAVCSTEFMPFVSTKGHEAFLYSVLNSAPFYRYMVQSSSSSTGSRKRMEPGLCLEFTIPYPNRESIISQFCDKVMPILRKGCSAKYESSDLESLRDFLLPMLMNGQVKVKEGA